MNNNTKLFTTNEISFATSFGGPLITGYLISRNYITFGNISAARRSLIIGVIISILFFGGLFSIPDIIMDKIPYFIIPFINGAIAALIVEKIQGKKIKEMVESGAKKESIWKTTGLSLLATATTLIVIFSALHIQTSFEENIMSFSDGKYKIYYEENIPSTDVNKIGIYLLKTGLFGGDNEIEIEVRKIINGYHLYIPIKEEFWEDKETLHELKYIKRYISSRLYNKTIKIIMVHYGLFGHKMKRL